MIQLLLAVIYISFISLGLPDGLLGAAWPTIYQEISVPVSYAGIVSMIICMGTIVSSLLSDRLTLWLGTGKITALSVAITAAALFGFSMSNHFILICLWAIPYGLGAGSVDASLNNYVALHYTSRHMSWLHCMWGLGASVGPYIMGFVLSGGFHWHWGYRSVGTLQVILTAIILFSLPLWKGRNSENNHTEFSRKPLTIPQILKIPGAKQIMLTFFCYCALEQTAALWASSYLVLYKGISNETAAYFASMFYIGITLGRGLNGFLTFRFSDTQLIRIGCCIIAVGIVAMLIPMGQNISLLGLMIVGFGCAPVYPCIIHSTPEHFGKENSQALIGVQMASAYVGSCFMPPIFGLIANHLHVALLPVYLFAILAVMASSHEIVIRLTQGHIQQHH